MAHLPPRAPSAGPGAAARDPWSWSKFHGFAAARRAPPLGQRLGSVPRGRAHGRRHRRRRVRPPRRLAAHVHVLRRRRRQGGRGAAHGRGGRGGNVAGRRGPDGAAHPKRVKRILANRQPAQRSRVRKLHYISELERIVTSLQMEVSALSPRVAFLDHQRSLLTVGNSHLKQRIAALAQDKIFKDAHQEALKKEIKQLHQLYHHQQIKATGGAEITTAASMQARQELLACEGAVIR